ncbi:uncharacterized protein FOMMEDRAFT_141361 [Fomitiporia mediterranea MF3/22]|uniref:uncharacterized protein n=1 Tax=Fomitiporia mediterranea (strain MF3/22) TaxID=694068 RepID=UPI00044081F7|nr:uncharacterized protein FOMMEDRAFT_141361 [Fomitiporia mediterranea MF3/22]EJD02249.1 hypothetical protein FOMMEDRAFT_141361 [Fomitiporia mediterranea MF3/22]
MSSTSTGQAPLKILTVGPAVGAIRDLFAKVKSIDAKHGKFELCISVGDFFGPQEDADPSKEVQELLNGEIDVPISCYIMQGDNPIPQAVIQKYAESGGELCKNLFLLSKSGVFTTSHGLRLACLGGLYDEQVYSSAEAPLGFSDPYFSSQTVEKLLSNITTTSSSTTSNSSSLASLLKASTSSHLVDIFMSQAWPASITRGSNSVPGDGHGVVPVDDIVRQAKPKYHFATGSGSPPQFWEREPYAWADEDGRISRFVSLGAFGGDHGTTKKPRWFYAFSITPGPSSSTSQVKPANATANPFTSATFTGSASAKRPVDMDEVDNFIFGAINQPVAKKQRHEKGEGGKPPPGYKCRRCDSTEHFITDCPERSKPPEGYICKICNTPGHLIRDCPEKNATGDTGGRKPPPGYVCRACASEGHLIQDCPVAAQSRHEQRHRKRGPVHEIGTSECWFCLSNPSVAKHLLVSIGSECYVTLPKGQIIPTGSHSSPEISKIPGGGHVLIVPITHYPTLSAMPPDISVPIVAELEQYKSALRALYAKYGCGAVMFEVGILSGRGGHAHVQVVPVPTSTHAKRVEQAFISEGGLAGVMFEDDPDKALEMCSGGRGNYFRVDLPDGKKMVHLIKQEVPFSIQFGRQVLCRVLGVPDRLDWKACSQTEAEEKADAQAFKQAFAPFDTMQS